eukprot:755310-Hanusia_phi.AAC.2
MERGDCGSKGNLLKHMLYSRTPRAHTSTRSSIRFLWYRSTISGARYASVVNFCICSSSSRISFLVS